MSFGESLRSDYWQCKIHGTKTTEQNKTEQQFKKWEKIWIFWGLCAPKWPKNTSVMLWIESDAFVVSIANNYIISHYVKQKGKYWIKISHRTLTLTLTLTQPNGCCTLSGKYTAVLPEERQRPSAVFHSQGVWKSYNLNSEVVNCFKLCCSYLSRETYTFWRFLEVFEGF